MTKNLLSPTKIKSFLSCKYTIVNDFYKEDRGLKKKDITKTNELRFKKGFEHEDKYFETLKKKYKKTINVKNNKKNQKERFQDTIKAMKEGYDVIRGGFFIDGDWIGETDFLIKTDKKKSNLGDYSYEVFDTKNTKKAKNDHVIQVGVYCIMLEKIQGVLPDEFHIVLKEYKVETIKLKNVYNYVLFNKDRYQNFVENDLDKIKPDKCSYCQICDWIEVCEKIWIDEDHLNQIGGSNKVQRKKLNEAGIHTIKQLAEKPEDFKVKNLNPEIFKKLNISAKLRKKYEETGEPQYHIIPENLKLQKGFNLLPKPSECDLFFDIESVQDHVVEGGLEYLFGFYYVEKGEPTFKPLWAHSREEEKKNLIEFFKFTKDHFKKYPDAKIYHYAKYEITALKKLVERHDVCETEYDNYLRKSKFVDLLSIVRGAILVSESSYSIKNLEKFYNFKRSGEVQKGDVSEDFYAEWVDLKEQRLLDEIEDYNKQDCHSTYELREWLVNEVRPNECTWYVADDKVSEKADLRDQKFNDYKQKIKEEKVKDEKLRQICSDIIGFYRRDNRPEWRAFFDRKYLSDEDLIEDSDCIGGLKQIKSPYLASTKQSQIYTFQFPDQEYKIKEGDSVSLANNRLLEVSSDYAGTVENLNQEKQIIKIMRGNKQDPLPQNISIGKRKPMNVTNLENSVYKYIDSLFKSSSDNYSAIDDILKRAKPRLKKHKAGSSIIKSNDFSKEIPEAVLNLDNSYLIMQGPPGTGKTFHASNVISELIKKKKKVAVSANSHKVIHNLLDRVEKICEEKNIELNGMKYTSESREKDYYNGKFIKNIISTKVAKDLIEDKKVYLYAGTKYHLCSSYYDQKIDYLFIDEAGQVSLSDVVVLGSIAKNIILIGDQMQLPQPTQGDHPGESGKSVLEYILQGKDTIPEDEGVFLNKTYRLHPKINEFTSNTFYDGRLEIDPVTEQRQIKYAKAQIQSSGIHFISADHKEFSQRNEVEGAIVKNLYKEFIGLEFTDSDGKKRKLKIEDILTISPYNVQVNYLKSILGEESRVGTIDKFQGQEAPITIISMTSSDSESLPRAKGFFFNRNRLNVAISRAQLASVIIFNPDLLETPTRTIEEIYLLENFFKLMQYQTKFN